MPPISNFQHQTQPLQHANLATMLVTPIQSVQEPIQSMRRPIQLNQGPTQQLQPSQQYRQPQSFQQPQQSIRRIRSSSARQPREGIFRRSDTEQIGVLRRDSNHGRVSYSGEPLDGGFGRVIPSPKHKKKSRYDRAPNWLRHFAT
jgi:hypothetical protein